MMTDNGIQLSGISRYLHSQDQFKDNTILLKKKENPAQTNKEKQHDRLRDKHLLL